LVLAWGSRLGKAVGTINASVMPVNAEQDHCRRFPGPASGDLRGGPRRAWFTLRLLGAVLLRRPAVFKEAVSFAVIHQAFHAYVQHLAADLDAALRALDEPQSGSLESPQIP